MADKDIDPVSGNHISPYMQDITGMFMLLAGKTDWMFRVSLIAELVPLVKKCYINPSRVLSVCHAIAVMLPAEWGEIQKPDQVRNRFRLHKVRSKPECSILLLP